MKVALYNKKLGRVVFQEESLAKTNLEVAANIYTLEIPEELKDQAKIENEVPEENTEIKNESSEILTDISNNSIDQNVNTTIESVPVSDKEDDLIPTEKWTVVRIKEYLTLFDIPYEDSELKAPLLKKAQDYYEKNVKK